MSEHDLAQDREQLVEDGDDLFGGTALGQRRESDDVREQDGHLAALSPERQRVLAAHDGIDQVFAQKAAQVAAQLGLTFDLGLATLEILRHLPDGSGERAELVTSIAVERDLAPTALPDQPRLAGEPHHGSGDGATGK